LGDCEDCLVKRFWALPLILGRRERGDFLVLFPEGFSWAWLPVLEYYKKIIIAHLSKNSEDLRRIDIWLDGFLFLCELVKQKSSRRKKEKVCTLILTKQGHPFFREKD